MILVTGGGGFIGRAVALALGEEALPLSHRAFETPTRFRDMTAVIHAGRDPLLGKPGYRPENDAELAIAAIAADRGLPFLTLSTRKVYAPSGQPLGETAPLGPIDRYGEQKLAMEEALERLLGDRLTRLRLANIFGFELGRAGFMGMMLTTLDQDDTITFDMSPFVARDFLPVETAAQAIARLAKEPPGGIVNIGSGIPLETGRLALAVIEGRGGGRLVVTDPGTHDPFTLEIGRMTRLTGIRPDAEAILSRARAIGEALAFRFADGRMRGG